MQIDGELARKPAAGHHRSAQPEDEEERKERNKIAEKKMSRKKSYAGLLTYSWCQPRVMILGVCVLLFLLL
jgi:hypothetical protein